MATGSGRKRSRSTDAGTQLRERDAETLRLSAELEQVRTLYPTSLTQRNLYPTLAEVADRGVMGGGGGCNWFTSWPCRQDVVFGLDRSALLLDLYGVPMGTF
jgi:hypothetical protein